MIESDAPRLDSIFHALSDGTRRKMLQALAGGERTVSELAEPFAISLAAASKHIQALERAGLIRREIRWRTHLCRLNPAPLLSAHDWLEQYEGFWADRLDALARLLDQPDTPAPPPPDTPKTGET